MNYKGIRMAEDRKDKHELQTMNLRLIISRPANPLRSSFK